MGSIMKPSQKTKKNMDVLLYFWSKKSGEIMDFTLVHIIYKDNIYKNEGEMINFRI